MIPNADATAYYRSVLDDKQARRLLDARPPVARMAHPTIAERMMTFSDLRAMVDRAELGIDVVLAAIPALVADPDPRLGRWALVAGQLPFSGLDDELYAASRAWLVHVLGPKARALGWQRRPHDSDDEHRLRQVVMSIVAREEPHLRGQAEKLADRWLVDRTGIADDMVDAVLSAAGRGNDPARFDRILAAAKAPRDRTEVKRLLVALAAFTDPALAKRALGLTLTTDFDLRESSAIIDRSLVQHETREIALAFLEQHID